MKSAIHVNEEAASRDGRIVEFLTAYRNGKIGSFLSFEEFQGSAFSRFWKNSAILRYEADRADFRIIFFGTGLVAKYGRDVTGLCHGDCLDPALAESFTRHYREALDGGAPVYLSGNFGWKGEDYIRWHAVVAPLNHPAHEDEVVLHVSYCRNPKLAGRIAP